DGDGYESGYSNEVEGTPAYKGPVWYVDDGGSSSGEGSSNDPMREIQDAIDAAASGDTVLVLPGTYDRSGDQELQFVTPSYTAKNIVLKSRDGAATTILDGEGNKLLIEVRYATDTTMQIIGFTIKNGGSGNGGSAIRVQGDQEWNGSEYVPSYYATAIFKNCIISDNADPGYPAFWLSIAKVNFIDCIIKNNENIKPSDYSYIDGGAGKIENGSQVIFNRCQIIDNEAEGECFTKGGALSIHHQDTDVKFINSVIARNSVTAHNNGCGARGGAFNIIWGANVTIINSTVVENTTHHSSNPSGGNQGGFVSIADQSTLTVFNSVIDNMLSGDGTQVTEDGSETETRISYSIYTGVDADDYDEEDYVYTHTPAFIDTVDIDPSNYYQLHPRSLAIGAGASIGEDVEEHTINAPTVDIAGNARPNPTGSNPDLGAYESTLAITPYPDAPSALSGTATHQAVSLSWTAPDEDDVVKYFVYQADSTSSGWSSWAIADTLDSLTSTATMITGLTNDRLYGFYVTSVDNSDYESSASSQVKLTPIYLGPVWYVDVNDGSVSAEGSPGDPFRDIQDAIDVSSAGDTVLVLPGTYAGNRSDNRELEFASDDGSAKNIVLKSRDGAATTFIDSRNYRSFDFDDGTDTSLQIIGFTITSTTGGEDDGGGALVRIQGQYYWDQNTQQNYYVASSATFRNCIFTIFDSGSLQGEDLQDVAVSIQAGGAIFDNCEF
ncbi:MAG: fibronectin type III domain-containing protein, partial [Candidatus Marinimicrobia bacterium]|nr:fibronectin type III domain-containing protein [Candidatus Neomarinimicrobiota bacterium]